MSFSFPKCSLLFIALILKALHYLYLELLCSLANGMKHIMTKLKFFFTSKVGMFVHHIKNV